MGFVFNHFLFINVSRKQTQTIVGLEQTKATHHHFNRNTHLIHSRSSLINSCLMDCYSILCFCNPHHRKEYQWRTKESNYIEQLKQLQSTISELIQQFNSLEEYHYQEKIGWQMEKASFLEKLNELQNALHQKEVVTQQYKVYEDSFRKERQQIQELLVTLKNLEICNEAYQDEVKKLNGLIESYRDVINVMSKQQQSDVAPAEERVFIIEEEFVKMSSRPDHRVVKG